MLVLHNESYNPRIDYLICKQLVRSLPKDYDEDKIRKCFNGQVGAEEKHEIILLQIKDFFENNDILHVTDSLVEELYKICTREECLVCNGVSEVLQNDLHTIADFVNETDCQRNILFQILFLLRYVNEYNLPIIPCASLCNKLFYATVANDMSEAAIFFRKMQNRTRQYMNKHSAEEGETCVRLFHEFADEFLAEIGAERLGYYGSFARGNATEYSDFDILVVFSDEKDIHLCKRKSLEFWRSKLPIKVDVAVAMQCNFDSLPIGIRRSVKFI